ncbi:MAG: hypothetical protein ACK4FA_02430 [Candidatus Paceibacteria bacterium]
MNNNPKQNTESLINLFGLDSLPQDVLESQVSEIGQMIFEEVLQKVLPILSEEDLSAYEKLVEQETEPDELLNFFFEKIPNLGQIIEEEKNKFLSEANIVIGKVSN